MNKHLHALAGIVGLCLFLNADLSAQNVAINATGTPPNGTAMLDISSTTSGLLIPRMNTGQRTGIIGPVQGLTVYDITTNSYWYFDGLIWQQLASTSTGWLLAGNTLAGTEKLGSLNAQPVRFFSNNTERMRLLAGGNLLINSTAALYATDLVEVIGSAAFPYPISSYSAVANSIGMYSNVSGAAASTALYGITNAPTGFGLQAINTNTSGTAIIGAGNNAGATYLTTGSGGAFNGLTGAIGIATSATGMGMDGRNFTATGTGVMGTGNNIAGSYLTNGSGGAFKGTLDGIFAYNTSFGVSEAIYTNNGGVICRMNYWNGATQYKIIGTGSVSCIIPDTAGVPHVMHCPESPEILFTDYGQATLVNGKAHVELDPNIAANVTINEKHPLRVYVQLEGDCNGVYITNKTATGFDVVELKGGNSNVAFQWNIVCNAADMTLSNGREAKNADIRFEAAPADKEMTEVAPVQAAAPVVRKVPNP